jgi:hypothetical protein
LQPTLAFVALFVLLCPALWAVAGIAEERHMQQLVLRTEGSSSLLETRQAAEVDLLMRNAALRCNSYPENTTLAVEEVAEARVVSRKTLQVVDRLVQSGVPRSQIFSYVVGHDGERLRSLQLGVGDIVLGLVCYPRITSK